VIGSFCLVNDQCLRCAIHKIILKREYSHAKHSRNLGSFFQQNFVGQLIGLSSNFAFYRVRIVTTFESQLTSEVSRCCYDCVLHVLRDSGRLKLADRKRTRGGKWQDLKEADQEVDFYLDFVFCFQITISAPHDSVSCTLIADRFVF